jgi:Ca2+-binding EF-hand superfamily protein
MHSTNPLRTITPFICTIVTCLLFSACKKDSAVNRFDSADKNADGVLSLDEVSAYFVVGLFLPLDTDKSGGLTMEEWNAVHDPGQAEIFNQRDADKDGIVTLNEGIQYAKSKGMVSEVFKKADTNRDKVVSREEATAYYASTEGAED